MSPAGSGFMFKDGDNVTARLTDAFGMVLQLTGVPETQNGVRGYAVTLQLVEVPFDYAVPNDEHFEIAVVKAVR